MIQTLVERIEEQFELLPIEGEQFRPGQTLAEAVSNSLIPVMPRISPELFDIKRRVNVTLSDEQKERIDTLYKMAHPFGELPEREYDAQEHHFFGAVLVNRIKIEKVEDMNKRGLNGVSKRIDAKVPLFSYAGLNEHTLCYPCSINISYRQSWKKKEIFAWPNDGFLGGLGSTNSKKYQALGKSDIVIQGNWKPNFKLASTVKVPELPKGFIELGDEAVATYYDYVRRAPRNLRRETSLQSPSLGVLWIPTPKSFYATGEIPKIETPVASKGDPILILDILGKERNYRHAVAAWDIGEEEPFRNWLSEFSEGSSSYVPGVRK
jgi:hypothetical protein